MYLSQFDKDFLVSHVCMSFLPHVSAQGFQLDKFDCAWEFTFRKSAFGKCKFFLKICLSQRPTVLLGLF